MNSLSLWDLIVSKQLRGFARISANGFQLELQVPNLSASLSELDVQLVVFVAESGSLLS